MDYTKDEVSDEEYDDAFARAIDTDDETVVDLVLGPIVAREQADFGANVWTFLRFFYMFLDHPSQEVRLTAKKFVLFASSTHPGRAFDPRLRSARTLTFLRTVRNELTERLGKQIKCPNEYVNQCILIHRLC